MRQFSSILFGLALSRVMIKKAFAVLNEQAGLIVFSINLPAILTNLLFAELFAMETCPKGLP
jgi:hypothetical protein